MRRGFYLVSSGCTTPLRVKSPANDDCRCAWRGRPVMAAGGQRHTRWRRGLRQPSGDRGGAASSPTSWLAAPSGSALALILSTSKASAIFWSWCAKRRDDPCPKRSGGRLIAASARWLHEAATVVPSSARRSVHDARISAYNVERTTIFSRTARAGSKEPMQPPHMSLTALARFAQCTGFQERSSRPSSSDGAVTALSVDERDSRHEPELAIGQPGMSNFEPWSQTARVGALEGKNFSLQATTLLRR